MQCWTTYRAGEVSRYHAHHPSILQWTYRYFYWLPRIFELVGEYSLYLFQYSRDSFWLFVSKVIGTHPYSCHTFSCWFRDFLSTGCLTIFPRTQLKATVCFVYWRRIDIKSVMVFFTTMIVFVWILHRFNPLDSSRLVGLNSDFLTAPLHWVGIGVLTHRLASANSSYGSPIGPTWQWP